MNGPTVWELAQEARAQGKASLAGAPSLPPGLKLLGGRDVKPAPGRPELPLGELEKRLRKQRDPRVRVAVPKTHCSGCARVQTADMVIVTADGRQWCDGCTSHFERTGQV